MGPGQSPNHPPLIGLSLALGGTLSLLQKRGAETFRNTIISPTATINELGLFSYRLSCYTELISLIRAFPLCTTLYVRDCVTQKTPGPDAFTGLPQHTLRVDNLEFLVWPQISN